MKKEVNPKETSHAQAYELWMKAPNPMVTFFKTIDVTRIVKVSKRRGLKFNMLLDWCIGRAASSVKEFYLLPVGDKLMRYDSIAVNTIVKNAEGEVSSCDILYTEDLDEFGRQYDCEEREERGQFLRHSLYGGLGRVQSPIPGAHCSSSGKVSGSGFVR